MAHEQYTQRVGSTAKPRELWMRVGRTASRCPVWTDCREKNTQRVGSTAESRELRMRVGRTATRCLDRLLRGNFGHAKNVLFTSLFARQTRQMCMWWKSRKYIARWEDRWLLNWAHPRKPFVNTYTQTFTWLEYSSAKVYSKREWAQNGIGGWASKGDAERKQGAAERGRAARSICVTPLYDTCDAQI